MLRGDGNGHFTAVPPAENVRMVPRTRKRSSCSISITTADPTFSSQKTTTMCSPFGITALPAGNPAGVGARITVELTDGSTSNSEVYAGSGCYRQPTSACLFGYSDANPPRPLRLRWPLGMATQHPFPPESSSLVLSQP
jgi:hypothetical protein